MPKITLVAEQFTLDGDVEYVVYYSDGTSEVFKAYPAESN